MRAIWYDRTGPAREVLELGERPTPQAGQGQALIRVRASGVNPSDAGMRAGPAPMAYPRITPNSDGAGVVEAVGPGVAQSWVGKRVWFYNGQRNGRAFGSAAEYIELDVDLLSELPDAVSFAQGATLGIPCMTAHRSLFLAGPVQGRTVLVTGGAGAVGHYAVQLAAWAGATVIATVSSEEKAQRAREGGAHHVIDYRREDVAARVRELTDGQGVHHVVEVDFGGNLASTLASVRLNGSIAYYATKGSREPVFAAGAAMGLNLQINSVYLPVSPHEARRRAQADITRWIGTGERMLSVAGRFPLEDCARAHELVESGGKVGTVVVEP
ncbi:NADPH2:quinone reductase [Phenylobacterium haematophilum]|uniref:NADPH2:quinone reductase n=1 Tax=Phenylobacterium haematophilum TaxID=98513 RepID=A0A840A0F5_9CAUL|nr:NADPH:quinone reductase [Phenylobacterium haematophilum]MBB3891764.1 NADPH2:quinone reductase [Phenylobacterium haematophilum]